MLNYCTGLKTFLFLFFNFLNSPCARLLHYATSTVPQQINNSQLHVIATLRNTIQHTIFPCLSTARTRKKNKVNKEKTRQKKIERSAPTDTTEQTERERPVFAVAVVIVGVLVWISANRIVDPVQLLVLGFDRKKNKIKHIRNVRFVGEMFSYFQNKQGGGLDKICILNEQNKTHLTHLNFHIDPLKITCSQNCKDLP